MARTRTIVGWMALLPLCISIFLLANKPLLLKVPKIGFLLYGFAGGSMPGYMDNDIFQRDHEWLKSNDVVLSIPAKSGTTWMMYTMHQIRNKGRPADFRDIYEEVPWIEFVHYPGESVAERIEHMNNVTNRQTTRVFKSHASPPVLPFRKDVKYVVVVRNPYDVIASGRDFFANHHKKFAKMWGDFPPGAGEDTLIPEDEWQHMLLVDAGNGEPMINMFMLDLIRNWWPYRNQPNVLLLHYSDRIRNDKEQIIRLARFLNTSLTEEEVQVIAKQVSFQETKKVQEKLESRYILDQFKQRGLIPEDVFILRTDTHGAMVNKGPKRDGKEEMSAKLREGIKFFLEERVPSRICEWIINGGPIPLEEEFD